MRFVINNHWWSGRSNAKPIHMLAYVPFFYMVLPVWVAKVRAIDAMAPGRTMYFSTSFS